MKVISRKVFRTGLQSLIQEADGRFFVRLQNRTVDSKVEIPPNKVEIWKELLS